MTFKKNLRNICLSALICGSASLGSYIEKNYENQQRYSLNSNKENFIQENLIPGIAVLGTTAMGYFAIRKLGLLEQ